MKKLLILLFALMLPFAACAATPDDYDRNNPQLLETGHLYGESALVIDADTGEVLFSNNSRVRMYPASTTKLMTLLLGIEEGPAPDTVVTIPKAAAQIAEGSSVVPVKPGDKTYFGDLLYGFMLSSGNDGANSVAVLTSGSIDAFVSRMNERAAELGCEGTHFVNAHGLQDENHYTTAMDLARIAQAGLRNERYADIARTQKYTMHILRGKKKILLDVTNRNNMLLEGDQYFYQGCTGIKTGHTHKAGYCFVGSAERGGVRLITVTLNCPQDEQKWYDTARLFEYGFTRYTTADIGSLYESAKERIGRVTIGNADGDGGLTLSIGDISDPSFGMTVIRESESSYSNALEKFVSGSRIEYTRELTAPVSQGETLARLTYTAPDGRTVTASLNADRSVALKPTPKPTAVPKKPKETTGEPAPRSGGINGRVIALIVIGVVLVFTVLLLIVKVKEEQRRRRRRRKRGRRR